MAFFTDLEQIVIFFMQKKHKRSQIAKTILKKMNKTEYIMLPDFILFYFFFPSLETFFIGYRFWWGEEKQTQFLCCKC